MDAELLWQLVNAPQGAVGQGVASLKDSASDYEECFSLPRGSISASASHSKAFHTAFVSA